MIAALFVETGGVYYGLPDVDPWDAARDARNYTGPHSVVAHPPCARWCRLAGQQEFRHGRKVGADDGCFKAALDAVRKWGGVLEHPAHSQAFDAFGLPEPQRGHWQRGLCGGWTTEIDQGRYGHMASKPTWLYCVGDPPALDWTPHSSAKDVQHMSRVQRIKTPIPLRDTLLAIARSALRDVSRTT